MNKQTAYDLWKSLDTLHYTREIYQPIQDSFEIATKDLYKKLIGKKTSNYDKAFSKLKNDYPAELEILLNPFKKMSEQSYADIKTKREKEFAKVNTPEKTDELILIKSASGGDYHTQGYGANKYAKNSLNEDITLLQILGYNTEIRIVDGHNSGGQFSQWFETYQLWANISEFDFYLLGKSGEFISVLNWAALCWRNGTNPKVYFQFLSQDDYEKSQALAYNTKYEITKDNMKLELSWDEINLLKKGLGENEQI